MTRTPRPTTVLVGALLLIIPHLPFVSFSILGNINVAAQYSMVAIALVVLTGWSGNISLGHAALVGVGAYVTGLTIQHLHLPFPVNMLWAAAAGAIVASLLGMFALRIRGLYLAVATLIFSWMADAFLFRQDWFTAASAVDVKPLGRPGTFPYFDWTERGTYYYAAWATVIIGLFLCANLRDSKTGRAFFAVRGSEVAAASLGIDVVRTKLAAFAVSGALASVAGSLIMIGQQVVTPEQFSIARSLFFLSIAVVGGLNSLGGAVAASLVFAGLDEIFFRVTALSGYLEVVSAALLTAVLLLYRGGLAAVPAAVVARFSPLQPLFTRVRDNVSSIIGAAAARFPRAERAPEPRTAPGTLDLFTIMLPGERSNGSAATHAPSEPIKPTVERNGLATAGSHDFTPLPFQLPEQRDDRPSLIEANNITVRFGGLTAVNDFSLTVREGEIVGLIGPNGAGKTTLFNAIAGLNVPVGGSVRMFGQDVTGAPVHERARMGVGRTFQAIQLFSQLSVFDNLMVATHMHNPTGLPAHAFVTRSSLSTERRMRAQAHRALQLLDLEDVADRSVAGLPFGVLRMVELARALVTGARVIMLDEPASGLDSTETERLADILRFVRSLGVTLLLIEHDVRMVTSVSDYIYVIDRGTPLAEGTPDEIKRDPRVIAAYLGEVEVEEVGAR